MLSNSGRNQKGSDLNPNGQDEKEIKERAQTDTQADRQIISK